MQNIGSTDIKFDYDRAHTPVATVSLGERFSVETQDCFSGRYASPEGFTPENRQWVHDYLDGVTGPIAVSGAKAGDVLAVTIHRIEVTTPGSVVLSRCQALSPYDWWHEEYACDGLEIRDGKIDVFGRLEVPISPVVGCIATAPSRESVLSVREGRFGGNLDCHLITTGTTVHLPVEVDSGLLYFGDCKARMGDGEICQPPEIGTLLELSVETVDNVEGSALAGPRLETESLVGSIVSDVSVTAAARLAFRDLLGWLEGLSDWPRSELAVLLATVANVGICQISNTLRTAHCVVEKQYLPFWSA